jgi:ABC-type transporter Mla subunit MlaD
VLFASRFSPDWTKPQTGQLNKSPRTLNAFASRYKTRTREIGAAIKRIKRLTAEAAAQQSRAAATPVSQHRVFRFMPQAFL